MEENIYYTHAGFFHADEVTGYAILELANICTDFERLTNLNNIPDGGIVADIGREYDPTKNRFDHHQGFFTRKNGYPMASAGMIWKEYGELCAKIQTGSVDSEEIVCERYPGAKYVIAPSVHPGSPYCMVAVPIEPTKREVKKPIERPEWFKGFIHQGKWIAGGESVEELINLAGCQ